MNRERKTERRSEKGIALLIAIFGPHLVVFYLFGIAIAIGCAILLFELGTMLESRAVGLTAALALLPRGHHGCVPTL